MRCAVVFCLCIWLALGNSSVSQGIDAIYHGGDILTMAGEEPAYAEAVAVEDGKIVFVGALAEALAKKTDDTKVVDLAGKTLLPGFIDGHSHFINALLVSRQANCFSPPAGPAKSISDIITALQQCQRKFDIPPGEFIVGYGYDPDVLSDGRELTAADLDAAFPDHPVFVQHVSLHGAVCNSAALKKFNITKDTPTPPGGVIARKPNSNEPAGLLMETAWMPVFANMPQPSEAEMLSRFKDAQQIYAAAGLTTAQEGATMAHDVELLQKAAEQGLLVLDVVSYPFITEAETVFQKNPPESFGRYQNHFKLGGIKITADGSPQGKTAFFTTPYLTGGPNGEKDWTGEPTFPKGQFQDMVKLVYDKNLQLLVHCNGDAAIDWLIEAHEAATPDRAADRRTTVVHSQFVRPDQLDKYQKYNLLASFFTEHCFYFGDTHVKNRGEKQAFFLSPMKTALAMGIPCANHTDFNVSPIDQLFVVWSAVNRTSRSNKIIGPEERITPYAALQAITTGSAYMYREEDLKGTLEKGKLADFVILDQNPVKVDPTAIKDVQVLETIKEGKTIYSKHAAPPSVPAGEWLLESLNGKALPAGIKTPTLSVKEDGSLAGFGGVNRFFGKVATDDKKLFGPIGSTMMAGPPEAMKVESQLFQAFEKATRATSADGKLQLLDSTDQVLAEFVSQ